MSGAIGWVPLTSLVVTCALLPVIRRYAVAAGLVDRPGHRRSHRHPTPRGGGIAMGAGLLAGLVWILPGPWLGAILPPLAVIFVLGVCDDHRPVPVRWRLVGQLAAAVWLVAGLGGVAGVSLGGWTLQAAWLWTPLAVIAVIWLVNLHNFMDGSNGLAAGQGIFTGLVFGGVFWAADQPVAAAVAFALAAVCLAFLPWNLAARGLFMGDAGSMTLGLMVAVLALLGMVTGSVTVWQSLMISSVFVVDATATLLVRLASGKRWYTPHRQHAYQRLIAGGMSHAGVALLYAAVNLLGVLPAVLASVIRPRYDFVLAGTVCIALCVVHRLACRITDTGRQQE